jgi:16S rRNA processing protein RimM
MTADMKDSLLWVGRVVKTQGIKGDVKISSFGEGRTSFGTGNVVYLENKKGEMKHLTIRASRSSRQMTILSFQGVKRAEEAEALVDCSVYVPKESLESLPPGEFYWYQLLGMRVKTESGTFLGTLEEIMPTGSNDVFVVRKDGQEVLIPATDEVVVQVNLQEKLMVIRPLKGLLPEDDL